jgi:ribonuclease HII
MIELDYITDFPHQIMATDEVGRGPLGGPVVVGAIQLIIEDLAQLKKIIKELKSIGIDDSKKLTPDKRQHVLKKLGVEDLGFRQKLRIDLKGLKINYVTWEISAEEIDQENILAASLRGMKEASKNLSQKKKISSTLFIDGPMKLRWPTKSPWNEVPLIKGDSRSPFIGLASIIAKEKRDTFMKEMHEIYPEYGFNKHFGYPTAAHRKAIETYGPSPIHRKTFKGVREFIRS